MGDKVICVIYRASCTIEDNLLQELEENRPKTEEEWKSVSFFKKIQIFKGMFSAFLSDTRHDTKRTLHMYVLTSPDGSEQSFPFGDEKTAPDNKSVALQKAVNAAFMMEFHADSRSLSLFANDKIDRLILTN